MGKIEEIIQQQHKYFFPKIKKILNKNAYIIGKFINANESQDKIEGFDAVYISQSNKIAVRIRKYQFARKYMDITIRSKYDNGHDTEIHKIKNEYGDYYIYCWETPDGKSIHSYIIFDIKKFVTSGLVNTPTGENIPNDDGTYFNTYSVIDMMKAGIIIIYEKLYQGEEIKEMPQEEKKKHASEIYKQSKLKTNGNTNQ
jgi:hypothetical protein